MWLENDFRGIPLGNRGTLFISIVNDLLNPKITVPTSKGVDSYVQLTAKHNKIGQKLRSQHFMPYLSNSFSTNFISIAMEIRNTSVHVLCI